MTPWTDILTGIRTRDHAARNAAGGAAYAIDDDTRIRRFLILGTEGGTYYSNAHDLTRDNAGVLLRVAAERPAWLVAEIVAVSTSGRAPKQQPCLFALAAVAGVADDEGRRIALAALPLVARTGTHLFTFATYVEQFRGWGRALRRAVADWYVDRPLEALAYQVVKYRQRDGWSHRDLVRLAHPRTDEADRKRLFDWVTHVGPDEAEVDLERPPAEWPAIRDDAPLPESLRLLTGFERARRSTDPIEWADLVREFGLSWEMLPTDALNEAVVWRALLDAGLPQTALLRQLPRLTRLGLLDPWSPYTAQVTEQLTDAERLRKARVHPIAVLTALRTYAAGHGARSQATWEPQAPVTDALDRAFYSAFGNVEPTGARTLLALDVSGSMGWTAPGSVLSAREVSAAMALVTAATEPDHHIVGFSHQLVPLAISPRQRLDDAVAAVSKLPFGATDCAQPMLYAQRKRLAVDTFVVYTDNETWAGDVQPDEALRRYRADSGIDARLVVVGITATRFSIADPDDAGMLDVAGFDAAVPGLIADFAREGLGRTGRRGREEQR